MYKHAYYRLLKRAAEKRFDPNDPLFQQGTMQYMQTIAGADPAMGTIWGSAMYDPGALKAVQQVSTGVGRGATQPVTKAVSKAMKTPEKVGRAVDLAVNWKSYDDAANVDEPENPSWYERFMGPARRTNKRWKATATDAWQPRYATAMANAGKKFDSKVQEIQDTYLPYDEATPQWARKTSEGIGATMTNLYMLGMPWFRQMLGATSASGASKLALSKVPHAGKYLSTVPMVGGGLEPAGNAMFKTKK